MIGVRGHLLRIAKTFALITLFGVIASGATACNLKTKTTKTTPTTKTTELGAIKIGDSAPDFDMRNQDQLKMSLSEFRGKKNVVLVFYPADFTPV